MILVLAALILCALMLVILLERGKLGLQSASASSEAAQVRNLADMAVNRVKAQILDATTLNQTLSTPVESRDTWASQPGAIRVYAPTRSGELRGIYKLYSSDSMQVTTPHLGSDVPEDWYVRPAEFVDLNEPVREDGTVRFPILNPSAASLNPGAKGLEEGFAILADAPIPTGGNANPAPMPVRWIYVLRDGTLCQLGDERIDLRNNPIIGRIAFWTDDETAKVNINTASPADGDAFWDMPRAGAASEINAYAWRQPAQNEYQRYPGHPAMVSMKSILGDLDGIDNETYYTLPPRYRWGGSEDGSKAINEERTSLITTKQDRAHATIDELLFESRTAARRSAPDAMQLESLRFFLTASSRAPELNLFGQPRVCIWPVFGNPDAPDPGDTRRTPYDRLIAFNSTIGGMPYYFTREDPGSPTHDFDRIRRNRELYEYLRRLTATRVPGFGQSDFLQKYGPDRDQILTQIFDYIRTTNLNETYWGRHPDFLSYTSDWRMERFGGSATALATGLDYSADGAIRGAGLVVPIQIGETRGMGRFPVINEVGLLFVNRGTRPSPPPTAPPPFDPDDPGKLEAMLVIETITPAFGYMPWIGKDIVFELAESDIRLRVGDREMPLFPASALGSNPPIYYPPLLHGGRSPGGYDGAAYAAGPNAHHVGGTSGTHHRFFSDPLDLEDDDEFFTLLEGTLVLNVLAGDTVVQSYEFEFPTLEGMPLPVRSQRDHTAGGHHWIYGRAWFANRMPSGPFDGDVVRSLQLRHGDARLVAGKREVGPESFSPHPHYTNVESRFAHGFRINESGRIGLWNGGTAGTYVDLDHWSQEITGDTYRSHRVRNGRPSIPHSISSLREADWSGDFDNGFGQFPDGPFINKPDEGMLNRPDSGTYSASVVPYAHYQWSLADGLFSPLRQVPSPVMFGSLPTGVKEGIPWRTLLFCPNPHDPGHKGFDDPPDHLLLDLFRMPVVEPFAISGPASTDGKINMNFAIAPFDYIRRASSWYALLRPLKLFAVPDSASISYTGGNANFNFRREVDVGETLRQFQERFDAGDIFRSSSEICSVLLVPEGESLEQVRNSETGFWSTHRLTGDNSRERPYAELYPKVTTQSNTFRIHMRVQALPETDGVLPPGRDNFQPRAEYRGSRLIERYLDPNNPRFANVDPDQDNLNELFQFRVIESRQFAP